MLAGLAGTGLLPRIGRTDAGPQPGADIPGMVSVTAFGAKGDGITLDSPAINKAIAFAAARGGGTVHFPAGTYACYSLRLKSRITLHLDAGATILAAEPAANAGYDAAEGGPDTGYQDFGHSHWQNSLIWADGCRDIAIVGAGLIWGKGLNRGHRFDTDGPDVPPPGAGNKAIALKNCVNVLLRDIRILQGGWFAVLATGVDNMTIDNLVVDTNRDGFDIDCCRNVRIDNCTVNSPWDDGICPKSSVALGYPRATEYLTISNCYLTGNYEMGSVIDGTWKTMPPGFKGFGRIKLGTESNGGFRNITVTNCVFDHCFGLALETVDGAICEDITISNISMRGLRNSPLFMRLGRRMRGPKGVEIGRLRRILVQNIVSHDAVALPSIIAGIDGHPVEDIKISDVYLHQTGGAGAAMAALQPREDDLAYPDPSKFGDLPATGFYIRRARNIEMTNVEVAVEAPDARPAFWLRDVVDADFFRLRLPAGPAFHLDTVTRFRSFGSRFLADRVFDETTNLTF